MILFLTSSPTGDLDGSYTCSGFDTRNGFAEQIRKVWKKDAKVLMITASPNAHAKNAEMLEFFQNAVLKTDLTYSAFDLWESTILDTPEKTSAEVLHSYDVIILGGGHVPTQQKFFYQLKLQETIQEFEGIVIGISAGTMNCAEIVYAQPEEKGEGIDPNYQKFIPGLGLTKFNILPHYQITKDYYVDGLRMFEDITYPDSMGKEFLALPDGSYVMQWTTELPASIHTAASGSKSNAKVVGEAYLLKDAELKLICENGKESYL